jgi:hypothetical protein
MLRTVWRLFCGFVAIFFLLTLFHLFAGKASTAASGSAPINQAAKQ